MPATGRILGIDFGTKRIGLAVSDFDHKLALPIDVIENTGYEKAVLSIAEICKKYNVLHIVIGNPVGLSNEKTAILSKVMDFKELLESRLCIDVVFEDERFTSVQSGKYLQSAGIKSKVGRKHRDSIAASIFLQVYLDKLNVRSK